jgi:hypothetical protein
VSSNEESNGEIWSFDEPDYEHKGKQQWRKWPETTPRVGVVRITSACGSGEWARSGGGSLLSTVSQAGSTRGAESLLTYRISARIEAS